MLLWTQVSECLFETVLLIPLSLYSEVKDLLAHRVILFVIFWYSSCAILYFPSTLYKSSNFSTSLPALVISSVCVCMCFNSVHLIGVRFNLIVVLISVSLLISNVEHLFIGSIIGCLCIFLFKSFAYFQIMLFVVLLLGFRSSPYILDINPLSDVWFANTFSHFLGCLSALLIIVFWHAWFFNF